MRCILGLHNFGDPQQMELLFNSVQPLISLERFFYLFKDRFFNSVQPLISLVLLAPPTTARASIFFLGSMVWWGFRSWWC